MSLKVLVSNATRHIAQPTKLSKIYQKTLLHRKHKQHLLWLSIPKLFSSHEQENIIESPFPDLIIPDMQLPNFLWDHNCEKQGDRIALVCLLFYM